jgi:hypothetical protein
VDYNIKRGARGARGLRGQEEKRVRGEKVNDEMIWPIFIVSTS